MALEVQGLDGVEQPEQAATHELVGNGQAYGDGEQQRDRARAPVAEERSPDQRREAQLVPKGEAVDLARDGDGADEPRKGLLRRHPSALFLGPLLFILVAAAGYLYWDYAKRFESTDDAFIAARQFAIAPKVSGYLTAVPVTDNQHVAAGDVIARIDERDFRVALDQAQAQVASAQAGVQNIDAQITVQQAQIASNQAQVDQAQASMELARVTWGRDKPLVEKGWASPQQGTIDEQNLKSQEAAVQSAKANLMLAQRQIESLKAQRESAI